MVIRIEHVDGVAMVTADVEINATWQVSYRLVPRGRRVALAEVRVWATPGATLPAGGLSAGVLRKVRVGAVVDQLSRLFAMMWVRPTAEAPRAVQSLAEAFPFLRDATPPGGPRKRPGPAGQRGRQPLSELLLASAAAAYLDAIARGSARPVPEAAKRIHETPERMRDLLNKARTRGLLTTVKAGVAGGSLTPRAKEVLRRQPQTKKRRPSRGRRKGR